MDEYDDIETGILNEMAIEDLREELEKCKMCGNCTEYREYYSGPNVCKFGGYVKSNTPPCKEWKLAEVEDVTT